jgi:hypothetical protein
LIQDGLERFQRGVTEEHCAEHAIARQEVMKEIGGGEEDFENNVAYYRW